MNSPLQSDPWIGRLIGDRQRYRLDKRLGTGGMGDVFLAMDTLLGQPVALKLLKDTLVAADELRKRFEREVALCAALKSDHIVEVSDYGVTAEGHPFYVMEYLRGQSLGQLLRQQLRLSVSRTVGIISQVCEGLHHAHQGVTLWRDRATIKEQVMVIHRDLKPDNIFLVPTALGELVKILDFGIAKILNPDASEYTNATGMFIGTFRYAAPEQLAGETDLDGRADLYSLGIILYEMLSGSDPFGFGKKANATSGTSWAIAHTSKLPLPLRSQLGCEQLSPALEAVVMRCLQKLPSARFASVDELNWLLKAAVDSASEIVITQLPQSKQVSGDQTVFHPLILPKKVVPNAELVGILMEIVGPIASTLLQQASAQAASIKELVESLTVYLSPQQLSEFEKKVASLPEFTSQSVSSSESLPNYQTISPSFVNQCERDLTDLIGPIAKFLIQNALNTHPQISPSQLVYTLAGEISDPQKAERFCQHLLELDG